MDWSRIVSISGAYTALLIGGAFATGQEAMQFFVSHGAGGIVGLGICWVLLAYSCGSLISAGRRAQLSTNEQAFRYFCGRIVGTGITWYVMVMIVAVYGVMLAGVGATLQQAYGLPVMAGTSLMAACTLATLLLGLQRIVNVLGVMGPGIVALTVATAIATLLDNSTDLSAGLKIASDMDLLRASDSWQFSALLYVGLALPGMAGFLPPLGATLGSKRDAFAVAALGPALFIMAMALVVVALLGNIKSLQGAEAPVLVLATNLFPAFGGMFAAVIFLGIFTTVTPMMWTVCRRFAEDTTPRYRALAVGLTLLCWIGGNLLPFGQLVNLIYPTVGFVGLFLLACQIYTDTARWARRYKQ